MQARPTTRQAGLSPPITPRVDTNTRTDSSIPTTLIFCCTPIIRWTGILGVLRRLRKQKKKTNRSSSRSGTALATGVMLPKRTIYSNTDIAKLMNQWFVNVKVDSEQRPDVDRIYMLARLIMTGGGGWPNNLFLTPDLKPFYAGSYFPPKDGPRAGAGFPTVLASINHGWTSDRAQVLTVAENVMTAMRRVQSAMTGNVSAPVDPGAWMAKARDTLLPQFDPLLG